MVDKCIWVCGFGPWQLKLVRSADLYLHLGGHGVVSPSLADYLTMVDFCTSLLSYFFLTLLNTSSFSAF